MFENIFKNTLATIGGNGDASVIYNDDNMKFTVDGEELDLSKEENVKKAYDMVDAFAENPLMKLFMSDNAINEMIESAKNRIDSIHTQLTEQPEEEQQFEDDAEYVANAYLEDTVEGWENVPAEQKTRSIRALAYFFNWMKKQAE